MMNCIYRLIPRTWPLLLLMGTSSLLLCQDTRSVKEPTFPPICSTLKATFTSASATSGAVETEVVKAGNDKAGLDTSRVQNAIDDCEPGHAVELAADGDHNAFLISPITLRGHVALLIDKGVVVYASRNPESYAETPGSCGVVNDSLTGCKPLFAIKHATGAAIMGDGVIDGQGGSPMISNGTAPARSWWELSDEAPPGGHAQTPKLIASDVDDDFTLYRITLRNSPKLNLSFHRGDGLTVWGVRIDTSQFTRTTAGIVVEQARNITITQSFIRAGGAAIAFNAGDGPTTGITITHNHLYWGRGLFIGPDTNAGVSQVRVEDLAIDGAEMGLGINSDPGNGGVVDDVIYDDVCIRNSKAPILFDSVFAFPGRAAAAVPVYQNIILRNVRISGGGKIRFNGFDATHRIGVTLDGVQVLDRSGYSPQALHTDFNFGPGPVNLVFTGDDSTINGNAAKGTLPSCATKWMPFPK